MRANNLPNPPRSGPPHRRSRRIRPLPPRVLRPVDDAPSGVRSLDAIGQTRVQTFSSLAYQLARAFRRYRACDIPRDELIGEALYGLTYAAGMYDEDRGVPFSAYAAQVVRHRLVNAIITWRRQQWIQYLPGVQSDAKVPDSAPDVSVGATARDMCEQIRQVLPARLYVPLRLFYLDGLPVSEISARLGFTPRRVRQLLEQAADLARKVFPGWVQGKSTGPMGPIRPMGPIP
jgi:RNA polymerase sigma factor (sigma-70 family)